MSDEETSPDCGGTNLHKGDCLDCENSYENHYEHCGVRWDDVWSCACNDRCPVCNAEIEPYDSTYLKENAA